MKKLFLFWSAAVLALALVTGPSSAAAPSASTQSVAGGGVTAKVTFLNPKGADDPRFRVVLDTHSVNLDGYDMKSNSVLRDDSGKTYAAKSVENKGGGHHREATIAFGRISQEAKRVEMVIKNLGGVKERTFRWTLE